MTKGDQRERERKRRRGERGEPELPPSEHRLDTRLVLLLLRYPQPSSGPYPTTSSARDDEGAIATIAVADSTLDEPISDTIMRDMKR
jgi:hypothetical protein